MSLRNTSLVHQVVRSGLVKSNRVSVRNFAERPTQHQRVKELQKHYAVEDMPVFLKGGFKDQVLFRFTAGLCMVSLTTVAYNIYNLANKKK